LRRIFNIDKNELKRLKELEDDIDSYYEVGKEVANAYVEAGTYYGNAMLDVFSTVEKKLNESLRKYTTVRTEETVRINVSIESVMESSRLLFIILGFFALVLAVVGYQFLMSRDKLSKTHDKLKVALDSIWGEMELAKKIQTVLLPEEPEITGYEIAGHMVPADEVGGDYYDIINVEGKNWIVIGDVSGHGVPAGLIMMMVQTSIQTTLKQFPEIPPSKLLTIVNMVIAENIKKLGEDKYMTITVLACHENGEFNFSGLHQDIMVYRNDSDTIELIETNGMWLGIVDDIDNMNSEEKFLVKTGDSILLYTDGITEAMDEDGNMFSDEKLFDVFKANGSKGAKEIKESLITSLDGYKIHDDVTIVVVKKV